MERSGIKPQGRRFARSGGASRTPPVRAKNKHTGLFFVSLSPYLRSLQKNCALDHFRTSSKSIALTLVFLPYDKIAFHWRFCRVNCVRGANEGVIQFKDSNQGSPVPAGRRGLRPFERKTSTQACFLFRSHPISGACRKTALLIIFERVRKVSL